MEVKKGHQWNISRVCNLCGRKKSAQVMRYCDGVEDEPPAPVPVGVGGPKNPPMKGSANASR